MRRMMVIRKEMAWSSVKCADSRASETLFTEKTGDVKMNKQSQVTSGTSWSCALKHSAD
jgi:hypothetical protein